MQNTAKLYEAFGELIYVIAMADGKIQPEELKTIEAELADHPWGKDIRWSFDYEVKKGQSVEELYKKVITYCEMHGPEKEYQTLIDILDKVARASNGVNADEKAVMTDFVHDLTTKFKADIEQVNARRQ